LAKNENSHDVIIIGGGPGGLTAGLYTSRGGLDTALIERGLVGGQISTAEKVDNYPGFPDGIGGRELTELIHRQATKYGLKTIIAEVTSVKPEGKQIAVNTTQGDHHARALIIATGSERQKLGVPGEQEFSGKGVAYCATCDAAFFRNVPVAVVGGGNAAITEAMHLTKFASKVTIIHRRDKLRASAVLQGKALAEPKIDFLWDSVIEEILGKATVNSIRLRNVKTDTMSTMDIGGVFVAVGLKPSTEFIRGIVDIDQGGYIVTGNTMETSAPGIFAVGDVRQGSARQAIIAAGDGATAALYAEKYLAE